LVLQLLLQVLEVVAGHGHGDLAVDEDDGGPVVAFLPLQPLLAGRHGELDAAAAAEAAGDVDPLLDRLAALVGVGRATEDVLDLRLAHVGFALLPVLLAQLVAADQQHDEEDAAADQQHAAADGEPGPQRHAAPLLLLPRAVVVAVTVTVAVAVAVPV